MSGAIELSAAELALYLARLGLARAPAPTLAGLTDLTLRHMEAVPFENLDVVAQREIVPTTRHAVEKIIVRRRGGFCFEVNEAFRALLSALGFVVRRIEARVWIEPEARFGDPFDHLALVVTLEGTDWLVDVGFGDNNRAPLRLPDGTHRDISGHYRLCDAERRGERLLERTETPDDAHRGRPLYLLTTEGRPLEAFAPMCRYHQTSPRSIFTRGLICTRATASGRITMSGTRLVITDEHGRRERAYEGDRERDRLLGEHFGIR